MLRERDDRRRLRRLVLNATRDYPAVRLAGSDDYVFLTGLSGICLYAGVTGPAVFDALQTATSLIYLPRTRSERSEASPRSKLAETRFS